MGEFTQAAGVENIDKYGVIIVGDGRLLKQVVDQSGFAHAARRDERDVVAGTDCFEQGGCFCLAVAKVLWLNASNNDKRIFGCCAHSCEDVDCHRKGSVFFSIIKI